MFKENLTVTVKRPREQVFAALTDLDMFAKASDGKISIERVAGKPARGAGEAFRITSSQPGMEEIVCETTAWDPPRRCARRFDIKDLPTSIDFSLEDCAEGTRLTIAVEMEPKSMIYKMLLPVLGKKIQSEKDRALAMLQERLDTMA